jgi:N-acyl-D-amino-acid deacylase
MWADIVVFDPALFQDTATYQDPRQFSPGLITVLINGEIVLDQGRYTGQKPGRVLYGPAKHGMKS